jgi:hypothetical protein
MTEQRGRAVGDERSDSEIAEAIDLPLAVVTAAKHRLARILSVPASPSLRRDALAKLIGDDALADRLAKLSKLDAIGALTSAIGAEALPRVIDRIVGHSDADFDTAIKRLEKSEHFIPGGQLPDLKIDLDRPIGSLTLRELQDVTTTLSARMGGAGLVAAAPVAVTVVAAVVGPAKLIKDYKDAVDDKRHKDSKDEKDNKENKDNPDHKREKDATDAEAEKSRKDLKDSKDEKESKDRADQKFEKDRKDAPDQKQLKDHKEGTDVGKNEKDRKEQKDLKDADKPKEVSEGPPPGSGGGPGSGTGSSGTTPGHAPPWVSPDTTLRELFARLAGRE